MSFTKYSVPYTVDPNYSKRVAYFSMEFAVHQPLKIYSGGLGFLAGSHLRSAYELKQNLDWSRYFYGSMGIMTRSVTRIKPST